VPAEASFHTWRISEVYSDSTGTVQFIELQEVFGFGGQHSLATHTIASRTNVLRFSDLSSAATANKFLLLGTPGYAALPGAVPPDFIISSNFFAVTGDRLDFGEGTSVLTFGAGALPVDGIRSLRADSTTGVNTPVNFAGQSGTVAARPPRPAVGSSPVVNPAQFRVTVFASGLYYPRGMLELADGSLLVGTSTPAGGTLAASTGELVRLVDGDGDGEADGPGIVLASGLPGIVTALRLAGSLVVVSSAQGGSERVSFLRQGTTPADPLTLVGSLDFAFPAGWINTGLGLEVRPTPGQPGRYDVFFTVGASGNDHQGTDTVGVSGLLTAALDGASLYRVTVDDLGGTPIVSALTAIATGVRNGDGLAIDPATGDLYLTDRGMTAAADPETPISADELNRIAAAANGSGGLHFGFPGEYIEYGTGTHVGSGGILPLTAFQPLAGGGKSTRARELALAPPQFPVGLNDGFFVGFDGRTGAAGAANEGNPVVYVEGTGQAFHFIAPGGPQIGHPGAVLATADSLYVADLSRIGALDTTARAGVIYRITPGTRRFRLTVGLGGTGFGSVTSTPGGVICGTDCAEVFDEPTMVTLTPTPQDGSQFKGWIGDPDCADGVVTMSADVTCTAVFEHRPDLIVSMLSAPTVAAAGGTVAVIDRVQNQGTVPSIPSTTTFLLSKNAKLSSNDVALGSRSASALIPGGVSQGATILTIPRHHDWP
jgi:glucose/arabinose dehydrogenase